MKKSFLLIAAVLLLAACGPNREKEIQNIERHEMELSAIDINESDSLVMEMVDLYRQFAANFPEDSLAPAYLMRAAEVCINIGQADQALEIIDNVIASYPGFEDIAGCYFMKGYAYETVEDYDSAREAYTYFVENYPDHYLASDTRKMLNYIGMTPEEMFEAVMNAANDDNLAQ